MKWLVVEDASRDTKGHWAEYISTFVRGLTALGDELVVVKPRGRGYLLEKNVHVMCLEEALEFFGRLARA